MQPYVLQTWVVLKLHNHREYQRCCTDGIAMVDGCVPCSVQWQLF